MSPVLVFQYSLTWDANNWVQSIRKMDDREIDWGIKRLRLMAPSLVKLIEQAENNKSAYVLARSWLKKNQKGIYPVQKDAAKVVRGMKADWKKFAPEYWLRLGKILDIPVNKMHKKYTAYYTTAVRCPFDRSDWSFMYCRFWSFPNTAGHEIMHMEYWDKYGKEIKNFKLTPEQDWALQECLTILLNEEMSDILPHPEKGYVGHDKLRDKILQIWRRNGGDFKRLLPEAAKAARKLF